jgi:hypothetical protein
MIIIWSDKAGETFQKNIDYLLKTGPRQNLKNLLKEFFNTLIPSPKSLSLHVELTKQSTPI